LPNLTRNGIVVWDGVQIDVLECLRNWSTSLWVVTHGNQLRGIDVLVEGAIGVDFDGDCRWKVELRVESASAMTRLD
jgi:hypothetical protein